MVLAPLRPVDAGQLGDGHLRRRALAEPLRLVDPVTVDRQRDRAPELDILEERPLRLVLDVEVERVRQAGALEPRLDQVELVVAGLLALHQQRVGVQGDHREIRLTADDLQPHRLAVRDNLDQTRIDVGKLLPGAVHRDVVGVALLEAEGWLHVDEHERRHGGPFDVALRAAERGVIGERILPVVEPLFLGLRVGVLVELGVPLLQPGARLVERPVGALVGHQVLRHLGIRLLVLDHHGDLVDGGDGLDLRGIPPHVTQLRLLHVVEMEREVLGREGVAVGPLRPLPKRQREGQVVVGEVVVQGQVGLERPVEVHPDRRRRSLGILADQVRPRVRAVAERDDLPAVGADLVEHRAHLGLQRQPLLHRRQLAGGHPCRKHGRFLVVRPGRSDNQRHYRCHQQDSFHICPSSCSAPR